MTVPAFLAVMLRTFDPHNWWPSEGKQGSTAQGRPLRAGQPLQSQFQSQIAEAIANQRIIPCLITQASREELTVRLFADEHAPSGRMSAAEFDEREYAGFEGFVGRTVEVILLNFDPEQQVAEVSRRRAREIQAAKLLPTLRIGQVLKGSVWVIQPFGAFIEIGGIHALLPVNEISHTYVKHPADLLKRGDEVEVKVIGLEVAARKVRVSLKAMVDPWETAVQVYQKSDVVLGTISGLQADRLYVRPNQYFGLEILCPAPPQREVSVGTAVSVRLSAVDPVGKRLRGRIINWTAN